MTLFLIVLLVSVALLAHHVLRVIEADAPSGPPSSHADWSVDALPSSAYSLQHDA